MQRVAAVIGRAVVRQQLRDVLARRDDAELVLVSATASAVRARILAGDLDLCVVDPDVVESDELVRQALRAGVAVAALLHCGDPAAAARRLGLRSGQAHCVDGEAELADVVATMLAGSATPSGRPAPARPPVAPAAGSLARRTASGPTADVVVIGSSTGGPDALTAFFGALPPWFDLPILIVQHMPPRFTAMLATSLDKVSHVRVGEAQDGTTFGRGEAWIAPGGWHMVVTSPGRVGLHDDPPVNSCRPSADVLFESVAAVYGRRALAVVLTGMGNDGAAGAAAMHRAGARVVVQDEASSVVWGMPGAVVAAGVADEVVPIERMVETVLVHLGLVAGRRSRVTR